MAIKIQQTIDIAIDSVKCVVYGGPGVGKTRLAASMPTPIIISAEQGLLSLADVNVSFIEVSSLKEWDETYRWAKSSAEANNYESICLDTLAEIAEVLVAELKPQFKDGRQAYMALADSMMPMLRKFRDLKGKHTLFTSKLIRVQDEESGVVTEELLMPGKVLGTQIPYLVDEYFKLETDKKGISMLQTAPSRLSFAKDRSGALDNPEKPDMSIIINKILAKRKQSNGTIT
jgi:AAA domain